jgi:hypothetical protein
MLDAMVARLSQVRRSILATMGVIACGPEVNIVGDTADDSGSGQGTSPSMSATETSGDSSNASESTTTTTVPPNSDDASTDTGRTLPPPCVDAVAIVQSGIEGSVPTGFEICENGVIHRSAAVVCEAPWPAGEACSREGGHCTVDEDCTEGPYGRCVSIESFFPSDFPCGCTYGCATDRDCADGQICACGSDHDTQRYPASTRCVSAECTDDSACDEHWCALARYGDCVLSFTVACTTDADTCVSDFDCADGMDCRPQDGEWSCSPFGVCG